MSINQIKGGNATNVIPDNCTISIDIRTLPNQPHQNIIDQFEKIFAELKQQNQEFQAKIETQRPVPAMESDDNSEFIKQHVVLTTQCDGKIPSVMGNKVQIQQALVRERILVVPIDLAESLVLHLLGED